MFDGFARETVTTAGGAIHLVRGGAGPPVLLLHGDPQTHAAWHRVARREDEGGPVPAGTPVLLGGARCRIAELGRMD